MILSLFTLGLTNFCFSLLRKEGMIFNTRQIVLFMLVCVLIFWTAQKMSHKTQAPVVYDWLQYYGVPLPPRSKDNLKKWVQYNAGATDYSYPSDGAVNLGPKALEKGLSKLFNASNPSGVGAQLKKPYKQQQDVSMPYFYDDANYVYNMPWNPL